ncbi:MAG: DUF1015 family protein [Fibrobacterota bacterium]|nr:DUF1015 family protein [Fibrobacterota bacterium]QQS04239.1 MAG: DUF1015 family protein [Fibrobacterota bacterium]
MSAIAPFAGLRYDSSRTGQDLVGLVCPPLFTLGPSRRKALFQRHPWNWIRVESGSDDPEIEPGPTVSDHSIEILNRWREEGVMATDPVSLYPCSEKFTATVGGIDDRFDRKGFFASVDPGKVSGLSTNATAGVRRPEVVLHEIPTSVLEDLGIWSAPIVSRFLDDESVERTVHRLDDPKQIHEIQRVLSESRLVHLEGSSSGSGPLLCYLVSVDDPGLILPPIHRIYRELAIQPGAFLKSLSEIFEVEELPYLGADGAESLLSTVRDTHHGFVFRWRNSDTMIFARAPLGSFGPFPGMGKQHSELDATILEMVVEGRVLGLPAPSKRMVASIAESTEGHLAMDFLDSDPHSSLAVLANPPSARAWFELASAPEAPRVRPMLFPAICSGLVALPPEP